MRAGANPRVDRPEIPAEYGTSKATEHVEWGHVEDRLTADRVYWIATVGQCGRPRVRPIDGVYVDGVIYVGGSPKTRWVRELAANPQVSVHLDGLREVVIVEGDADVLIGVEEELARRLRRRIERQVPRIRHGTRVLPGQRWRTRPAPSDPALAC